MRGRARVFDAAMLALFVGIGCGPKQPGQCAALAGGVPPASRGDPTQGTVPPAAPVMQPVSLGRVHGFIATAAAFHDAQHWTPTLEDVRVFESGLVEYLRAARPREEPELYRIVPDYKRQYEGELKDGRRVLYVLFRCPDPGHDDEAWSKGPMIVADGGKCYFDIHFEIAACRYSDLTFNGEA